MHLLGKLTLDAGQREEIESKLALLKTRLVAELVLDLWISGRQSGEVEQAFDELAGRRLEAKKQHMKTQGLEDRLFAGDFEV